MVGVELNCCLVQGTLSEVLGGYYQGVVDTTSERKVRVLTSEESMVWLRAASSMITSDESKGWSWVLGHIQ